MKPFFRIVALSALFFGGLASASASSLLSLSPNLSDQLAGVNGSANTSSFHDNYLTFVYADPNNTLCANCLDFVYIFADAPGSLGATGQIAVGNFGAFSTVVGVDTLAPVQVSPVDFTSSGGTITFDFNPFPINSTSSVLVVETNAFGTGEFQAGNITISNSTDSITVPGFQPIPEPATLSLLGTGLLGAVGVIRRRFAA